MGCEAADTLRVPLWRRRFDNQALLLVPKVRDSSRLPAANSQAVPWWLLLLSKLLLNCLQAWSLLDEQQPWTIRVLTGHCGWLLGCDKVGSCGGCRQGRSGCSGRVNNWFKTMAVSCHMLGVVEKPCKAEAGGISGAGPWTGPQICCR